VKMELDLRRVLSSRESYMSPTTLRKIKLCPQMARTLVRPVRVRNNAMRRIERIADNFDHIKAQPLKRSVTSIRSK